MARGSALALALAVVLLAVLAPAASRGAASADHRGPFGGLGTWVDIYGAEWAEPKAAVAAMAQHGVRTLYLETGNYSHRALVFHPYETGLFVDAAHAAGMRIVAWYLPSFAEPKRDLKHALAAIRFRSSTGQGFDGFALDIEATKVRSLALRDHRLLNLSVHIRHAVHRHYPLGAITPSPVGMSPYFWPNIPYSSLTRYYKAFLPMAYFTLRGIHTQAGARKFIASTITRIRTASGDATFPIHIIGGLSGSMGATETAGFMRAVAQTKPFGYSLYAFGQTTPATWKALARRQ